MQLITFSILSFAKVDKLISSQGSNIFKGKCGNSNSLPKGYTVTGVFAKKNKLRIRVFLEISQNSQENTCTRVSF